MSKRPLTGRFGAWFTNLHHRAIRRKKLNEVPGPPRLPLIGSGYLYSIGVFHKFEYHNVLRRLYKEYGSVVREDIGLRTVVHIFELSDVRKVYSVEGKIPTVPPLQETTKVYRNTKQMSPGLGNTNGNEWYKLRSAVQKMMLRPKEVHYYLPMVDKTAKKFVSKLERSLNSNCFSPDLRTLVAKWSIESSAMVCFEKEFGALEANSELAEQMILANKDIFTIGGLLKLSLPLYKYINTPKWNRFSKAEDFFYNNAMLLVDQTIEKIKKAHEQYNRCDNYNFMSYLLSRKDLSINDVAIITLSLFADGLSTTTPTLMFNLYCLAKHQDVQARLFVQIKSNISKTEIISVEAFNKMPLLKAVVKETFRMYPNGTEISRILPTNLKLGGYEVPKGTHVDLNHFVQLRNPKYFQDPESYQPDRWLRMESSRTPQDKNIDPFLLIPFGHGTRMCAGRRFAEQDLYTALTRIVQEFNVQLLHPQQEIQQVYNTLLFPKDELRLKFIKR